MKDDICKLCRTFQPLCESHIIPEFLYEPLYDEKHRFNIISTNPNQKMFFQQKGIREYLLCKNCEKIINKNETYVAELFSEREKYFISKHLISHGKQPLFINKIDYKKFKLFQLSVLWRASQSSLPLFSDIKLGKHSEIIRKMIFDANPGYFYQYGCCIVEVILKDKTAEDFIYHPTHVKSDSRHIYRFAFGGFLWIYEVSSHSRSSNLRELFLTEDGGLVIPKKDITEIPFLMQDLTALKKARKI